jgi:hypothetical protein
MRLLHEHDRHGVLMARRLYRIPLTIKLIMMGSQS